MDNDIQKKAYEEEINQEELSSATDVIHTLVKTTKAFKMYHPNNPLHGKFFDQLHDRLVKHIDDYGDFRIDIDQFEFKFRGEKIYENRDPKDSLAFRMYADGIRKIILTEGIEESEIYDFLNIIGKDLANNPDDDMVTQLWMKNLPHVNYFIAEESSGYDFSDMEGDGTTVSEQAKGIRGIYSSVAGDFPQEEIKMPAPQKVLTLTELEIEWIKKTKEEDEHRNPKDEVIHIITSILAVERDPNIFEDLISITLGTIENLLDAGDIRHAVALANFLVLLSQNQNIPQEHRNRLIEAEKNYRSEELVKKLYPFIESSDRINQDELKNFIYIYGKGSLAPFCRLLGAVKNKVFRKLLIDCLVDLGKERPQDFIPFLKDKRWYLVRNIIYILRIIGSPAALEFMPKLINHNEIRVRREVLNYLREISHHEANKYIPRFLNDEKSSIRIQAIKAMTATGAENMIDPIVKLLSDDDFEEKDITEKQVIFEALGELGSERALSFLKDTLMKKFWFNKAKERESVLCAVAGLRKVRSPAALEILKGAASVKKVEMAEIINRAIRELSTERA